ncbi:MAG: glycerate kinase [Selenomonadales bacterium]|nr:glycerate kinase [Selenomonadales bacterium]
MKIVIAPDSYKGSVSAVAVAQAMERGVHKVFPDAQVIKMPIADGGEGTVETMIEASGGTWIEETVVGPLGEPVKAGWGIMGDGVTGVIEMAAASGLPLVGDRKNPWVTTTYGTGELIVSALNRGLKRIIIGIGGSATNDGGAGMARALGVRFLDVNGEELANGGGALTYLASIDVSGLDKRINDIELLVACDVDNPLCGPTGASAAYGPQKGATPDMVEKLDAALANYAAVAEKTLGKSVKETPGAGAAGGLGAGLLLFTKTQLRPGVDIILEVNGFDKALQGASLVLTGEGQTDFQTARGKAPVGAAKWAKKYGIPVVCISGGLGKGADEVIEQGIDAVISIAPRPISLEECLEHGEQLIEEAAERVCRIANIQLE